MTKLQRPGRRQEDDPHMEEPEENDWNKPAE
jgi:hypothetical protein